MFHNLDCTNNIIHMMVKIMITTIFYKKNLENLHLNIVNYDIMTNLKIISFGEYNMNYNNFFFLPN